jgi:acetylornithine/succinyldiaminopimelate/putrescine aminotransferase
MEKSNVFFDRHLAQTTPFPFALEIERAQGIYLYGKNGEQWMDLISGVGVSNIGHGHPKVVEAIKTQAEQHLHVMVYGEYVQGAQNLLAERLTNLLPSALDCCYFVNSGAEAIEAALKLAKRVTGRTKIVSARGAYHGSTHGALSVSGNEMKKRAFRPLLPDVHFLRFNAAEDLDLIDAHTACVILETVQGDAGIRIPDKSWLKAVRKRCDETGALLILDEIQAGMGRTGKFFAFEHFGVVPDILTLGKALGGGLPIGAMISSRENMELLTHGPMLGHITTFGGHPLVCAAAAAGLEVLTNEVDLNEVERLGALIERELGKHPKVKAIRRIGYYFAIDMESTEAVQHVVEYGLEHGFISFWFLSCPDSFRIAPPLTITEDEVKTAITHILKAFDALPA